MKYLGVIPENRRNFARTLPLNHTPQHLSLKKRTHQTHILAGTRAYSMHDSRRTGLILLNNLLGGPGMSSRLNLAIREKYGFAYSIDSGYTMYSDTGLWTVYIGTDHHFAERSIELVMKELRKLKQQPLGHMQLMKAKNQLIGQMAVARESNSSLMIALAKTWLVFNKIDTFEEIVEKINAYSAIDLCDISNEIFDESQFSYLIFRGK
jgi:predicted Zn-dependent peptidase